MKNNIKIKYINTIIQINLIMCQKKTGVCNDEQCENCYDRSFASHPKAKYWSEKNDIEPRFVAKYTSAKYTFECKCGHTFSSTLSSVSRDTWCPYCTPGAQTLCEDEDCELCFNRSFASHPKAKFWSNENELSPRSVFKNSDKIFKFDCNVCDHTFESELSGISRGRWCNFCVGKKLCQGNDCKYCFNRSFASHPKSKYWSPQNDIEPRFVTKYSSKKFDFICKCGHTFCASLNRISAGNWCSYCSYSATKLCENINCLQCYYKSFLSHPKSAFWAAQNELDPRFVFRNCVTKYFFVCENKHVFLTDPSHIVSGNTWCPFCKNKTEAKLYKWLKDNYPNVDYQKKYSWCKNIQELPFDFVLEDMKIIIEMDGAQHFEQISNWASPEDTQKKDIYKMKQALDHNYSIIRILQEDVWNDNYDWDNVLGNHIKKYKNPKCIYLTDEDEYDNYKQELSDY